MPRSRPAALVFDLDGVLLRTTMAKHDAMLSALGPIAADRDAASRAILRRGGVPRHDKLREIHAELTGRAPVAVELDALLQRYEDALREVLGTAPLIPDAGEFVRQVGVPCYVCSAATGPEIRAQLARHDLATSFEAVFDGGTPKAQALAEVARRHAPAPIVFFGDAIADLLAAREARVAFVGVTTEANPFAAACVPTIEDFLQPSRIFAALDAA